MNFDDVIARIDDVLNADVMYDETIGYQLTTDDVEWLDSARKLIDDYHHLRNNIEHAKKLMLEIYDDSKIST